jgi:hypothetical protein
MKTRTQNLLLLLGSLALGALLGELALRAIGFSYPNFHRYDEHTGLALRPGVQGWWREEGEAFVRINAAGMRDDREFVADRPAQAYRIAVLGDSYAEALQVPVERTFWRLLETRLGACGLAGSRGIEVLNFGVSGYSTGQELLALRHRVAAYRPDMVLLAFLSGNDVRDNSREIAGRYPRPYFGVDAGGGLALDASFRDHWVARVKASPVWALGDHLRLMQLVNKVKNLAGQPLSAPGAQQRGADVGLDDQVYVSRPAPEWERAWRLTEALIAEVRGEAERLGARFLLVTLTNPVQVPADPQRMREHAAKIGEADLFYPERRLRAFAGRERIEAVFLAEDLAAQAAARGEHLHGFANTRMGTGHWNAQGHALAAELIAGKLCPARQS